jgi:hypothetical protein
MFISRGQQKGTVTLSVWNDGENGTIRCDLAPKSTVPDTSRNPEQPEQPEHGFAE